MHKNKVKNYCKNEGTDIYIAIQYKSDIRYKIQGERQFNDASSQLLAPKPVIRGSRFPQHQPHVSPTYIHYGQNKF